MVGKQLQVPRSPGLRARRMGLTVGTALSVPLPRWASQPGGCFQGGCSEGDKGRAGGAPGVAMCEQLLGTRVCQSPSLLFRLLMLSSGRELEHARKAFCICLACTRSLPHAPSHLYLWDSYFLLGRSSQYYEMAKEFE